jgi:heme A synthase
MRKMTKFGKYAWSVLGFNLIVILWGVYVRATGAGAGCGSHWPLCNGEIIPRTSQIETAVEFIHRLSSGIALLLVVGMVVWVFRAFPKGHILRIGAKLSLLFIITEALVGASLVLFSWVANDDSIGRVISMAVHLINTFLLLASLTLTSWWASGGSRLHLARGSILAWGFGIGFLGVLLLGVSGAITALGDTLFPSGTLTEGIASDFSVTSHFLIRLRVWHPLFAIFSGTYVMVLSGLTALNWRDRGIRRLAIGAIALILTQLLAGLVNLLLLAPVFMQIIHLFLADLIWITLVLLAANVFSIERQTQEVYASITSPPVSLSGGLER